MLFWLNKACRISYNRTEIVLCLNRIRYNNYLQIGRENWSDVNANLLHRNDGALFLLKINANFLFLSITF